VPQDKGQNVKISVYVDRDDQEAVDRAAREAGLGRSAWIRLTLRQALRKAEAAQ
jgi:hypothetical protein